MAFTWSQLWRSLGVPQQHHCKGRACWRRGAAVIKPKVFIIDMFGLEADIWYGIPEFNLLAHNISVIGLSPLFPDVHCTEDGSEINATSSITALVKSPKFDLTVARSKQGCIELVEATVLLTI
jgi:purine nucleoside permease